VNFEAGAKVQVTLRDEVHLHQVQKKKKSNNQTVTSLGGVWTGRRGLKGGSGLKRGYWLSG